MHAYNVTTGEYMQGEMHGDVFVVQSGADFDPTHEVYALDEVDLQQQTDDYRTELDNDFSDAVRCGG
jgi:hypothetical protein